MRRGVSRTLSPRRSQPRASSSSRAARSARSRSIGSAAGATGCRCGMVMRGWRRASGDSYPDGRKDPPRAVANPGAMTPHRLRIPDDDLVAWRGARLRAAGFDAALADAAARDCAMDLHALLDLVDRGCQPRLAVRIVAPLDAERRAC